MRLMLSLALLAASSLSLADEQTQILNSCQSLKEQPQAEQASACRFFIKGFMAASSLTGVPLDRQLPKEKSDFFKRAYDSRLGSTSSESRQQACDVPQNYAAVIQEVSENLPTEFEALADVKLVIINAIKNQQSCAENNS
ncbi:MAG: hypothetical protein HWE18_16030 [Gammaproteobacteria bacterium]|nr:hypothetical protein [Gammaproteobacteria bacterium]